MRLERILNNIDFETYILNIDNRDEFIYICGKLFYLYLSEKNIVGNFLEAVNNSNKNLDLKMFPNKNNKSSNINDFFKKFIQFYDKDFSFSKETILWLLSTIIDLTLWWSQSNKYLKIKRGDNNNHWIKYNDEFCILINNLIEDKTLK